MRSRSGLRWSHAATTLLAAAALAVTGTVAVVTGATSARAAAPGVATVEDEGADCPVSVTGTGAATSRLPDPFTRIDGTRITSRADWRCRREEIKKLAERYVYGEKPGKPESVTGTVSRSSISVTVRDKGKSAGFSASVSLPSGTGPFPAVFVLGGMGADTATIKAAGAAVINYDPLAVGKEGTPRTNKQGAFYSIYGAQSSTGLLMAWAWGVSRLIDVIEQSDGTVLRADATGVTGCSRYGKGAFVIGVFDQRIALTMPIESGSGGVSAFRAIAGDSGAQPLSSTYSEQPWMGDAFSAYQSNANGLPVDTHQMVGMVAPRGLFVMDNPSIAWLGAKNAAVSALAGAEIYKALGAGDNITYWSAVQDGTHCAVRPEWKTPLQQHIQTFLLGTGSVTGAMRMASNANVNLASWRDWQTPTLTAAPVTTPTSQITLTPITPVPTSTPVPTATGQITLGPVTTPTSQITLGPVTPVPTIPVTTPTAQITLAPIPPTQPTSASSQGCSAAVTVQSSWNSGFTASVRVTAGSSAISGWTVQLGVPGGSIASLWNGRLSGTSASNVSWNGPLAAGASTEFGFQGSGSPAGLTVNGCTAS